MSSSASVLDDLRSQIDGIDDAIHDLLMRRTVLVGQIAAAKTDGRFMRPGREAMILRRLAARHDGVFPLPALVRMWREMIGMFIRLQGPFAVAVHVPDDRRVYWDIARDHYGSTIPMIPVKSSGAAVRAVAEGTVTVAVVPTPEEDDADPWWRFLMNEDPKTPRVVARLPFAGRAAIGGDEGEAFAIAAMPHDDTGADHTLIGLELTEDRSRGRIKDTLEALGLHTLAFRSVLAKESGGGSLHLVEVADYVGPNDPRLQRLYSQLGDALVRATVLGGYAVPLDA
jgi:chorismate mutase